ncbi:hypothetical protein GcM3_080028 [Golovinomyces cichoracearum]|uniref:Uncharacterized protein n=1 Tax=Golovinomyces cichoracearum TaxID=62708 RepID=A0A420INU2_9PEZI|nr:hypothetical protein GcM3_080028 [Golovinomyces cichoracearum]
MGGSIRSIAMEFEVYISTIQKTLKKAKLHERNKSLSGRGLKVVYTASDESGNRDQNENFNDQTALQEARD